MTEGAKGLMAFWADFEPGDVEEIRRWHNCEHMAERVAIPGFLRGRRYRGEDGAATFLMMYETRDVGVLGSAPYLAALNAPTDWTRRALPAFRNPARNLYALVAGAGRPPRAAAPRMSTLRFNHAAPEAAAEHYRARVLPALAAAPGTICVRLWQIDEAISNLVTSERTIYGGGPGEQRFLLTVEHEDVRAPPAPAELPDMTDAIAAEHRNVFAEIGWLDFALETPA